MSCSWLPLGEGHTCVFSSCLWRKGWEMEQAVFSCVWVWFKALAVVCWYIKILSGNAISVVWEKIQSIQSLLSTRYPARHIKWSSSHSHCTDEETEAQWGKVTCAWRQSWDLNPSIARHAFWKWGQDNTIYKLLWVWSKRGAPWVTHTHVLLAFESSDRIVFISVFPGVSEYRRAFRHECELNEREDS